MYIYIERERGTCIYIYISHIRSHLGSSHCIWTRPPDTPRAPHLLAMTPTPVYALETGAADGEKVYVACCDNPKDGVFQQSASLLQSALMDSDCTYEEIDSVADDLLKPQKMHKISQMLLHRNFHDYAHFRVHTIPHGHYAELWAVGLGTNGKKLTRAANIALAVAIVNRSGDHLEPWLNMNGLILAGDPASGAAPHRSWSAHRSRSAQQVTTAALRSRSPHRSPPRDRSRSQRVKDESESRSRHRRRSRHRSRSQQVKDESERRSRHRSRSPHRSRSRHRGRSPHRSRSEHRSPQQHIISDMIRTEFPRPPRPWLLVYSYDSGLHYYWNPESGQTSYKLPQFQ